MTYAVGLASRKGRKPENQDASCVLSIPQTNPSAAYCLGVVADGVSTCAYPKAASGFAVDTFVHEFLAQLQFQEQIQADQGGQDIEGYSRFKTRKYNDR